MNRLMSESSIIVAFSQLPDPRKPRNQLYSLEDLISTAILATLCTCDDYYEISEWTEANIDWLQSVGVCLAGAPSHDTYERFFRYLDPAYFQECFIQWTELLREKLQINSIALDGKTLRNSRDGKAQPLHMVSAYATENNLVLGQLKTNGKGGELEGMLRLLEILDIKGAAITSDAAGCHKVIAEKIIEKKGDYVLALKGNQGKLHAEVENYFNQVREASLEKSECGYWSIEEKTRGRHELREVWASEKIDWLPQKSDWKGLRSIVCVKRARKGEEKQEEELRYFISSLEENAEHQGEIIRKHWGIENQLHWQLDVTYREDLSRVRKGNGAENLSVLRRATLNILKNDKKSKASLKRRRLRACWRRDYLLELIGIK